MMNRASAILVCVASLLVAWIAAPNCSQASGYESPEARPGQELDFEGLSRLISEHGVVSIEQLLPLLPQSMRKDDYILMYRSRSLQEATPQAPRAILFTPSATLLLSFNGGVKGSLGADSLETIQFNLKTNRFEFREIRFDGKNPPKPSALNPTKCLACHQDPGRRGTDMRPNWEPYFFWPGAFGSDDGSVSSRPIRERIPEKLRPQDAEMVEEQSHENDLLQVYRTQVAPVHPRYSSLGPLLLRAPVNLTDRLAALNFRRVVRLMMEEVEIYPYYRDFVKFLVNCGYRQESWSNRFMKWHLAQPRRNYFHYGYPYEVSPIITDLFEPLGVNTSDWSMDFGTRGRFAFYERFGTPSDPMSSFREALRQVDGDVTIGSPTCELLEKSMEEKLGGFFSRGEHLRLQARSPLPSPRGEAVAMRCAACHSTNAVFSSLSTIRTVNVPPIPFDQPGELAQLLRGGSYQRGSLFSEIQYRTSEMVMLRDQMPPTFRLTPEERRVFVDYLQGLQAGLKNR